MVKGSFSYRFCHQYKGNDWESELKILVVLPMILLSIGESLYPSQTLLVTQQSPSQSMRNNQNTWAVDPHPNNLQRIPSNYSGSSTLRLTSCHPIRARILTL